ncbi:hypothetical protein P9112_008581 [Eukaryota sp. TZLM1-RC]
MKNSSFTSAAPPDKLSRKKRIYKCSHCGDSSHNILICKKKLKDNEELNTEKFVFESSLINTEPQNSNIFAEDLNSNSLTLSNVDHDAPVRLPNTCIFCSRDLTESVNGRPLCYLLDAFMKEKPPVNSSWLIGVMKT